MLSPHLAPHPRLYISKTELLRLRGEITMPFLKKASEEVARRAEEYAEFPPLKFNPGLHNALLVRSREAQGRVLTLLVRWLQTGGEKFRAAAMEHIREMGRWEYWSSEAWLRGDRDFNPWYDLGYGENNVTLAIAYDWMFDSLSEEEKSIFLTQARERGMEPLLFLLEDRAASRPWWFGHRYSNWNTVCMGGAGMLALAMREELGEAATRIIDHADTSLKSYFEGLEQTQGGWVEGIGYWNYGHRYGFMYLLSHENATDVPHPFLALPGVRETLSFPLDFTPNGLFCSFPDVNVWAPLPFHYKAAVRLNRPDVIRELDSCITRDGLHVSEWAEDAEMLILHPGSSAEETPLVEEKNVARLYPGMDWAILADKMPNPGLYMSIRGGNTEDPHSMVDVLSFHVVSGREKIIDNYNNRGGEDYMETTFSFRRNHIVEMSQAAKNVLFINGVGLPDRALAITSKVSGAGFTGFRLDVSKAFGFLHEGQRKVDFCARLFLMLENRAFLIVDRFELPRTGRTETRMHSFCQVRENPDHNGFLLEGKRERMRVTYACNVEAVKATAIACPTKPEPGANILRWCTRTRTHRKITMVTLLTPGDQEASLRLADDESSIGIEAACGDLKSSLLLTPHLEPTRRN